MAMYKCSEYCFPIIFCLNFRIKYDCKMFTSSVSISNVPATPLDAFSRPQNGGSAVEGN